MVGGVAVIKVGAATETEMKEKKARVEDALNATRAAVEEGIVRAAAWLCCVVSRLSTSWKQGEEAFGVKIVKRALEEPVRQIANNAGHEGSVVVEQVKNGEGAFGFNAETEVYEDLTEAGVIDPTKVVRFALQNAASVASLFSPPKPWWPRNRRRRKRCLRCPVAAWAVWAVWAVWAAWMICTKSLTAQLTSPFGKASRRPGWAFLSLGSSIGAISF